MTYESFFIVLIIALTLATFVFIEWQFWTRRKGDKPHITRFGLAVATSLTAATINTSVLYSPEMLSSKMSRALVVLWCFFFIGLGLTGFTGWQLKTSRRSTAVHFYCSNCTRLCLYAILIIPAIRALTCLF